MCTCIVWVQPGAQGVHDTGESVQVKAFEVSNVILGWGYNYSKTATLKIGHSIDMGTMSFGHLNGALTVKMIEKSDCISTRYWLWIFVVTVRWYLYLLVVTRCPQKLELLTNHSCTFNCSLPTYPKKTSSCSARSQWHTPLPSIFIWKSALSSCSQVQLPLWGKSQKWWSLAYDVFVSIISASSRIFHKCLSPEEVWKWCLRSRSTWERPSSPPLYLWHVANFEWSPQLPPLWKGGWYSSPDSTLNSMSCVV